MDDQQRIEIERMAHGGDGIGYLDDGRIVFVPTTLPGEIVDIELVELKSSFGRGRVVEIVRASENRADSECPYFPECGGCQFWHATYDHEVELKTDAAWQTISRISKLELPESRVVAADDDRRYRSRVTFHRERAADGQGWDIGFYRANSHELVDVRDCLITDEVLNEVRRALEPALRDVGDTDMIIETADDDTAVVTLMPENNFGTNLPPSLKKFLETLDQNPLVRGMRIVGSDEDAVLGEVTVDGTQVLAQPPVEAAHLPSSNFRQTYRAMNHKMVEAVADIVDEIGSTAVVDLYCGNGNFSFALPERVDRLVGLEANRAAVESAQGLAELGGLDGFEFREAHLSDGFIDPLDESPGEFDLVLLDPPRAGAAGVCEQLADLHVLDAVVYVSCDPACLGRDFATLAEGGWEVESLTMFDMFPRTAQVETLAVLR